MMIKPLWIAVFFMLIYLKYILTLKVVPERAMKKYLNPKYLYNGSIEVKRYGRRSGYFINIEGTTKTIFGNNVSLNLIFFEFLHNEYKRSFVELHFKICDMMKSEPYVGGAFVNAGLSCPVQVGYHRIMNISVPADDFPNVWPFEKCKIEASLTQTHTNDIIATADVFVLFKQKSQG